MICVLSYIWCKRVTFLVFYLSHPPVSLSLVVFLLLVWPGGRPRVVSFIQALKRRVCQNLSLSQWRLSVVQSSSQHGRETTEECCVLKGKGSSLWEQTTSPQVKWQEETKRVWSERLHFPSSILRINMCRKRISDALEDALNPYGFISAPANLNQWLFQVCMLNIYSLGTVTR